MTSTRKPTGKSIDAFTHDESRLNIPTEELSAFVREDEETPSTKLYERDPSLDPQLVWKGKDEQDREDLAVPVVPIYIQEKIHPQAIIDDLRKRSSTGGLNETGAHYDQIDFFADFDGIEEFSDRIDFYQHEQHWSNRMILGDSLYVMASLAEKEGLKGKVQTIYVDPPYGIKFGSNWQVSTRKREVKDGSIEAATRQPEQVRAFRDTWKLGIHSYLSYLRDRLTVARELLTESGSIFVQIGDENVHLVRSVLDEVFGCSNFISLISFKKRTSATADYLGQVNDYLLWYSKNYETTKYRGLFNLKGNDDIVRNYGLIEDVDTGKVSRVPTDVELSLTAADSFRFVASDSVTTAARGGSTDAFHYAGTTWSPGNNSNWKTSIPGMRRLGWAHRLLSTGGTLRYKRYFDDFPVSPLTSSWTDTTTFSQRVYVVQTVSKVIERCILMTTDPGDLVLDPTCGSGTTAYVAEQWGRRWITIDTSRVALALARTRLMAGRFPYYLLADSEAGREKEAELHPLSRPFPLQGKRAEGDLRKGFVYRRVPHVTLKSIANNPDIREGMTRDEIDAAIARHADTETLYDQPYEDPKVVRVTGPFTVESLSPHRVLSTADTDWDGTVTEQEAQKERDFATMILENLRKAGVQNTYKGERIVFDWLDPFPGKHIVARGEFTDATGEPKQVAITIGPELGTVGKEQLREAAKEAMRGIGVDVLLVCGFAFDAAVSEEAKHFGTLTVLPTRMNPDLAMDELLKKTGAGNLFMVFGEPDIEIREAGDSLVVEIRGVDVYDPTTGEIRSNSTDDIACWFIDTNYDQESFFVRHAYFTGADHPYDKLKRALRAEIDESAWSSLYSTISQPFPKPDTGSIAIKVINHYGDEVLKIYEIGR